MNEAKSSQWQRLSIIIDKSKHTTNSFAKSLGLDKSERIYRIKRGQNGISRKLAELIHKFYPEYSVPWILCGSNLVPPPTDILEIPLFDTIEELLSGKTVQKFIISQSVAPTTRYALRYKNEDPDIPEYRQDTILLLRRHKTGEHDTQRYVLHHLATIRRDLFRNRQLHGHFRALQTLHAIQSRNHRFAFHRHQTSLVHMRYSNATSRVNYPTKISAVG